MQLVDRLRASASTIWHGGGLVRSTGVLKGLHPRGWPRFARALLGTPLGPHVPAMFHGYNSPSKSCVVAIDDDGRHALTWADFDAQINRLCQALRARGVTGGARVALMLPNCVEVLIAQQALARMGATAVQVGTRLKAAEIAFILSNAEPIATIAHAATIAPLRAARRDLGQHQPLIVVETPTHHATEDETRWDDALAVATPRPPVIGLRERADGGGVIVYTSGTTGKPKGANRGWKQTGLEAVIDMMTQVEMRADDRHLVVCPLYHSAAPAFVAMMQALGATTVVLDAFEPETVLRVIAEEHITCTMMVPTMLVRLCALPEAVRRRYDTRSLRWIMSGAAPLATETARQVEAAFGPVLWNFYGSTETGLVTLAGPRDHLTRPGTIGRPLRGNQIVLRDDTGDEVALGQVGELFVENATLIRGYHHNDDATARSMRAGAFTVGDLARRDADGYLYLESRKHDMVISGGVNIYPREIEDHLHAHPAVLEAAVVGVPDAEWGESLKAVIVTRPGYTLTADDVIAHCRAELADYKRPRQVVFVGALPRNPTGKVLKREL